MVIAKIETGAWRRCDSVLAQLFCQLRDRQEWQLGRSSRMVSYTGLYDTGRSRRDLQGLFASRTDFWTDKFVIRDRQSFLRFIDHIPEREMVFGRCSPASKDPLLQRPEIDFAKQMILAVVTHEPNRFIDSEIVAVEPSSTELRVVCRYSELGRVVAKVISYGKYSAAIVGRFDGEVTFSDWRSGPDSLAP